MNRSYQNSTPGFVYFGTNTSQENSNKSDTADFLAFNDSPQSSPQTQRFQPSHYSSPQSKFHRGSPRNYPHNNRRFQRRSWGCNNSNRSTNSAYNSSFNRSQSSSFKDGEQGSSISKFIHPSFLEDPWAELEAKLKEKTNEEDRIEQT